jgi:Transposase DDE domain
VPYKHSQSRSHKFTKPKYKVNNWPEYNDALRRRGDFTIWFTEDAITDWRPAKTGSRGRPQEYSDHAIETAILIRQVFHLPLRQTEGFMISVPPPKTAVCSSTGDTQRDDHIRDIKAHGRIAWQRKTGYGLRAHAELAMQRYKRIIGSAMKARKLPQQKTEAWVSASALNIMSNLGMPVSVKI